MSRYVVMATWDDVPHLSQHVKDELWNSIPPYQRDARSKGVPQLGSGAIYQVPESDIKVAPFEIPAHFPRFFGMDTDQGAGWTAATWCAYDREAATIYLYDCYKRSRAEVAVHADAIKARGAWIPGAADAAALVVTAQDAAQLIGLYQEAGLDLELPDKGVETGIQEVWELMSAGRFKVFASCGAWFEEFRLYRRDDHGRIVKQNDHLMDATRYAVRSGRHRMKVKPVPKDMTGGFHQDAGQAWMS